MIVIATHNGGEVVKHLLFDIKSFNIPNDEVCIVDNQSTDLNFLYYLIDLTSQGYKVLSNPESTYEIGAFKLAIDKYQSDVWFCFQDSIRLKQNIFELITPLLTDSNAYIFLAFGKECDPPYCTEFIMNHYGRGEYSKGTFGSMFFARNSVVQKVKNDWVMPTDKHGSQSMERGVSVVFDIHNIEIIPLDLFPNTNNQYFEKIFKGRS